MLNKILCLIGRHKWGQWKRGVRTARTVNRGAPSFGYSYYSDCEHCDACKFKWVEEKQ